MFAIAPESISKFMNVSLVTKSTDHPLPFSSKSTFSSLVTAPVSKFLSSLLA